MGKIMSEYKVGDKVKTIRNRLWEGTIVEVGLVRSKVKDNIRNRSYWVLNVELQLKPEKVVITPLSFAKLREVNSARCSKDIRALDSWTPLEWGGALAGETGELCNFLKKMRRGEKIDKKDLAHELADIITYADLLAATLDIDLGEAVKEKFNIVSKRWNSKYTL